MEQKDHSQTGGNFLPIWYSVPPFSQLWRWEAGAPLPFTSWSNRAGAPGRGERGCACYCRAWGVRPLGEHALRSSEWHPAEGGDGTGSSMPRGQNEAVTAINPILPLSSAEPSPKIRGKPTPHPVWLLSPFRGSCDSTWTGVCGGGTWRPLREVHGGSVCCPASPGED